MDSLIKLITEPNLRAALEWAKEFNSHPKLPSSLNDKKERAKLINKIDSHFGNICIIYTSTKETRSQYLYSIVELCKEYFSPTYTNEEIVNVIFRLWAGCISAAKTIGYETRSGINTPEKRSRIFGILDLIAKKDKLFYKGVEAAINFKTIRKQPYSLEGVPDISPVRI